MFISDQYVDGYSSEFIRWIGSYIMTFPAYYSDVLMRDIILTGVML